MSLRHFLVGNRRVRPDRVVGRRTVVRTVAWSVVAVAALTVYRTPALLDGRLAPGAVLDALPVALIPVVVVVVAVGVVLLALFGEVRYVLFGRRSGRGTYGHDAPDGGGPFESVGGFEFGGDDGGDDE